MPVEHPTREELIILIQEQRALIEEQAEIIKKLRAENLKLKERIASLERNSGNSSKPPSTDKGNFTNPPPKPKSLRKKRGKKSGGQLGHKGSNLKKSETPDHIVEHELPDQVVCPKCEEATPTLVTGYQSRQVVDIPPIKLEVTEHRAHQCMCGNCCATLTAPFPVELKAPVQYGSRIKALSIYLNVFQLLPSKRLTECLGDLFNARISEGTLRNFIVSAGKKATIAVEPMKQALTNSQVLHSDETGCNLKGKRAWIHVACTTWLTFFHFDLKRGYEAMTNMDILPHYGGRLIHDCLSAYHRFTGCKHGLCVAHILRELIYAHEQLKQPWAKAMKKLLLKAKALTEEHPEGVPQQELDRIEKCYKRILGKGFEKNPEPPRVKGKRGRIKRSKQLNLLRRLDQRQEEFLAFLYNKEVPFDNNQAERDLRMIKTREKISGGFGNADRAEDFCNLRSIISSAIKQKRNVLRIITETLASPESTGQKLAEGPAE